MPLQGRLAINKPLIKVSTAEIAGISEMSKGETQPGVWGTSKPGAEE
jgi:hypothetical protein